MTKVNKVPCLVLLILAFSLMVLPCVNALSSTVWSKTYGGSSNDRAFSLIQNKEGGYTVMGTSLSYSASGLVEALLIATDVDGTLLWNQTYSGLGASYPCAFVQTIDSGYALVGYSYDLNNTGSIYPWFAKTDGAGNLQWNRTYPELGSVIFNVIQTNDGGYALVGYITQSEAFVSSYLAKLDADGNVTWTQNYGTSGDNELYTVIQTTGGGYTLAGYTTSGVSGNEDFWLIGTDSSGVIQWDQTYDSSNSDFFNSLVQTADGGYALIGYSNSSNTNSDDYTLIKTNSLGVMEWNKTYGGSNLEEAFSGVQTSDGGYALTGVKVTDEGYGNAWLIKTDSEGNLLWNQTYGESADSVLYSIIQISDDGYVLAGYTNSSSTGQDVWLVRTDQNGVIPEFSVFFLLPLMVSCTIIAVFFLKKKITTKTL